MDIKKPKSNPPLCVLKAVILTGTVIRSAGYRHVRLRTPSNQPMELATLFVYSKHEEELLEPCNSMELSQSAGGGGGAKKISLFSKSRELSEVRVLVLGVNDQGRSSPSPGSCPR